MKSRYTIPRRASASGARTKGFRKARPNSEEAAKKPIPKKGKENPLAVKVFEADPSAVYSIDTAAQLAGVPRRSILIYCKHGLVSPLADPSLWGYWFTSDAIRTLRRIEILRIRCGEDLAGIGIILELLNEVEILRSQIRTAESRTP